MMFFGKVIVISIVIGALTPVVFAGGFQDLQRSLVAGTTGLLIGTGCLVAETSFLSNQSIRWLRHVPLIAMIAFRALAYSVIIVVGLVLPARVFLGTSLWQEPEFALNFIVSGVIALTISTAIELIRLLGREATASIFTGRYRRPRQEDRIVLFADLVGSTALAEKLGELRFHAFLSDVSYDLSQVIQNTRGEVHRYVGDAVIVTWPMTKPANFARSVACARDMPQLLARKSASYVARYGQDAGIRVALHCGPVAAGEIGTWKKEIALLGDTMNTVARIENAARDFGVDVVISDRVKDGLADDQIDLLTRLPDYDARGKQGPLALWTPAKPKTAHAARARA